MDRHRWIERGREREAHGGGEGAKAVIMSVWEEKGDLISKVCWGDAQRRRGKMDICVRVSASGSKVTQKH